jgi:hypothetical protein
MLRSPEAGNKFPFPVARHCVADLDFVPFLLFETFGNSVATVQDLIEVGTADKTAQCHQQDADTERACIVHRFENAGDVSLFEGHSPLFEKAKAEAAEVS